MKKCCDECLPCCDFCVHVKHEYMTIGGKPVKLGPEKCLLHDDSKHNSIAVDCGYCSDFECVSCKGGS